MATSLGLILILGTIAHYLFRRIHLPGFLGILLLGMLLGPHGFDWIDKSIIIISPDIRKIALVIILLRAGLGLHRKTLQMVGIPALKLGFIPVITEGFTLMLAGVYLFNISWVEAGMLGFIVAAVSPAVIVPKMLYFIEIGKGSDKGIPSMILAGASLDDVVAITLFSAFAGYFVGSEISIAGQLLSIPVSLIIGSLAGFLMGLLLVWLFSFFHIRHTQKVILILSTALLLTFLEDVLKNIIPFASLLGIMVIGFIIYEKKPKLGVDLSSKFSKIWIFAEILLFFLVGTEMNYILALESGLSGLALIAIGLLARAAAVYFSLWGTKLSFKEKSFCVMAYSPKATVQAAIGAVPLALGAPGGEIILTIAVLSIIVTAPIGSISMGIMGNRFLADRNPTQKPTPEI